jgi:hypothetical protein
MTWHSGVMRALASVGVVAGEHYLIAQCDHATLAAAMREAGLVADALVVDAPYSERTHAGHDDAAVTVNHGSDYRSRVSKPTGGTGARREIDYAAWSDEDVRAFVGTWGSRVRGWVCSLTDHHLASTWSSELEAGRYAFAPLACVERGSRARFTGDGPSQWSTWLVVARPRTREWQTWGTLPGAYVGGREAKAVVGGKPLWLMRAIVGDYSRPGDLVADPCMGAGTTLVAAVELGRRAIGCEPDPGRFSIAAKRLARTRPQLALPITTEVQMTQTRLGDE